MKCMVDSQLLNIIRTHSNTSIVKHNFKTALVKWQITCCKFLQTWQVILFSTRRPLKSERVRAVTENKAFSAAGLRLLLFRVESKP